MTVPLSVIMTVHNGEPFLREGVQSLLGQSYRDFELVVVDNGSQDDSLEVLRGFSDSRLRVIELGENVGRTAALNVALNVARGACVAVQDADDVSLPQRFERQTSWMSQHPDVALLGTWCEYIDELANHVGDFRPPTTHTEILEAFAVYTPFVHSTVMFRRDPVTEVGGYPADYIHSQDGALWVQLIRRRHEVANLSEGLVRARLHSRQLSASADMKLTKSREFLRLHRQIEAYTDLTEGARKIARRTLVMHTLRHGALLWRDGRWTRGLGTIRSGLACYGGLALRDFSIMWWIVRVLLVRVRETVFKARKAAKNRIARLRVSV